MSFTGRELHSCRRDPEEEAGRPERHCGGDGSLCVLAWGMSTQRAASRSPIGEAGDGASFLGCDRMTFLVMRVLLVTQGHVHIKVRSSLNVVSVSGTSGL